MNGMKVAHSHGLTGRGREERWRGAGVCPCGESAKIDATDDEGVTPLMLAAAGGHHAVVALLVKEAGHYSYY